MVSDIRIRDRYCNLDELSPRRYYEQLKIGEKNDKYRKDRKLFICKIFKVIIFLRVQIHICLPRFCERKK